MRYDETSQFIVFETDQETDAFLEPFNADDHANMPGWMYYNRMRYAREDAYEWLTQHFSNFHINRIMDPHGPGFGIYFMDKKDAMKFKLLWDEELVRKHYGKMA